MFPQVARYHKARTDKKEAYYLQQLQLFKPHRAEDVKKWEENPNTPYLESSKQIARVSSIVMENLESVQVKIDQTVFCSHLPENSFVMVQYKTVDLKYYSFREFQEARYMAEQLETPADLAEIGIDMDPAGEQDDAEASEEGSHYDEDLENLNPNLYALNKEVQESSLFRKLELPPKSDMYKDMQTLDKYQAITAYNVIRHCRDLVKAEKGNKSPEQILLVVSGKS